VTRRDRMVEQKIASAPPEHRYDVAWLQWFTGASRRQVRKALFALGYER
jgi:hypothetical protein